MIINWIDQHEYYDGLGFLYSNPVPTTSAPIIVASRGRKLIRQTLIQMLKDANTSCGQNVYGNRDEGVWEEELPAILVYTPDESSVPQDLSSRYYYRTLNVRIEIKAMATDLLDDALDDLIQEVEDVIAANRSISGTALAAVLTSTSIDVSSESETKKGTGTLNYEIKYIA